MTPKGTNPVGSLPFRVWSPYAVLAFSSAIPPLLVSDLEEARGFYIFACVNAAIYLTVMLVILVQHARENGLRPSIAQSLPAIRQSFVVLSLVIITTAATLLRGADGLEALAFGVEGVATTKVTYSVSGAGQQGTEILQHVILPGWLDSRRFP